MLPLVLTGLRIGMVLCIIGVLLAEMYASRSGIGRRIFGWGESAQIPELLAGILLVSILTIAVNETMRLAELHVGRFVTLVGPSGCGKSTLLQILAGLISATRGEVRIAGEPIRAPMPDKIGMVFQDPTLLPWKTALANVEFPLDLRGIDRATRRKRCSELLKLVGLGEFADNYPHELSGGMRQRVAIARGLAPDPRLMLMDEPFAALDEQTRTRMGHDLLEIWEKTRKTVFFITHSLTEAIYLRDRAGDERSPGTHPRYHSHRVS